MKGIFFKITPVWLLLLLLLVAVAPVNAEKISFKQVAIGLEDGVVLLDMVEEFELNETMLEALHSGVPLTFETRLDLTRDGAFFWQKDTVQLRLRKVLVFHPLSSQYEVHALADDNRQQFVTMAAALRALGDIRSQEIISVDKLDPDAYYQVTIQTVLDITALPLPLRPMAYLTPGWHLESRVYEWLLKP